MRFGLAAMIAAGALLSSSVSRAQDSRSDHDTVPQSSKSSTGVSNDLDKPGMAKQGGGKVEGPSHADGSQDTGSATK